MTYLPLLPDVVILSDYNKIQSFGVSLTTNKLCVFWDSFTKVSFFPPLNRFLFLLLQTISFNETIDNGTTAKNKTIKVTQPKKTKGSSRHKKLLDLVYQGTLTVL